MDRKETFRKLRALGEEACEAARKLPDQDMKRLGAVNWVGLGVAEVLYCEDEDCVPTWVVTIEEASPSSCLSGYVYDFIRSEMPDLPIEVRTEW